MLPVQKLEGSGGGRQGLGHQRCLGCAPDVVVIACTGYKTRGVASPVKVMRDWAGLKSRIDRRNLTRPLLLASEGANSRLDANFRRSLVLLA
jgi:hypothetical protein